MIILLDNQTGVTHWATSDDFSEECPLELREADPSYQPRLALLTVEFSVAESVWTQAKLPSKSKKKSQKS